MNRTAKFVTSSYSTVKTGRFPCTWLDPAINPQITHKMAVIIKLSKNALITQNTKNKAVNTCHWHNTIFPVTGSISIYHLMRNGIALFNCISFTNKTTSTHFDGLSAILCRTMLFKENDILTNGCGLHLFNCKFWLIESHTIQNLYPCTKRDVFKQLGESGHKRIVITIEGVQQENKDSTIKMETVVSLS